MTKPAPSRLSLLGERFALVSVEETALWRGDLIIHSDARDPDYRSFILHDGRDDERSLDLVHLTGHYAGLTLHSFPREASEPGARCLRIAWLRDNWNAWFPATIGAGEAGTEPERMGWGSFAHARFYRWRGRLSRVS